jgi:hypothetical protein
VHQCLQLWTTIPSNYLTLPNTTSTKTAEKTQAIASLPESFLPLYDAIHAYLDLYSPISKDTTPFALHLDKMIPSLHRVASFDSNLHLLLSHIDRTFMTSFLGCVSSRTPLASSSIPLDGASGNTNQNLFGISGVQQVAVQTPKFQESYNMNKDYDPIKERAQIKELERKVKREKKGAMREIKKDTQVIQQAHREREEALRKEREQERRQAWAQLEDQQRDTNILNRVSLKNKKKHKSKQ